MESDHKKEEFMSAKILGLAILLVLIIIFSLQNTQPITIKLLFWEANASSAFLILITFILGLGIGMIVGTWKKSSRKSSN